MTLKNKIFIDERADPTTFKQVHVAFKCGCSFYNDVWQDSGDEIGACPNHGTTIKALQTRTAIGVRSSNDELLLSDLKVGLGLFNAVGSISKQ